MEDYTSTVAMAMLEVGLTSAHTQSQFAFHYIWMKVEMEMGTGHEAAHTSYTLVAM